MKNKTDYLYLLMSLVMLGLGVVNSRILLYGKYSYYLLFLLSAMVVYFIDKTQRKRDLLNTMVIYAIVELVQLLLFPVQGGR